MTQQAKGLAWLVAAAALAVLLAVGLPRLAAGVPWRVEGAVGRVLGPVGRVCGDSRPQARAALDALTARLRRVDAAEAYPLSVAVVSGSEVNAFAALGGEVRVYDGLLREARSPEELAGVLAHEMEHVKRRHVIQGAVARLFTSGALRYVLGGKGGIPALLANLTFSRQQEHEADLGGLQRLKAAGVDARGFSDFFTRDRGLSVPGFLSDHPADSGRAELARSFSGYPTTPALTAEEWAALRGICR